MYVVCASTTPYRCLISSFMLEMMVPEILMQLAHVFRLSTTNAESPKSLVVFSVPSSKMVMLSHLMDGARPPHISTKLRLCIVF